MCCLELYPRRHANFNFGTQHPKASEFDVGLSTYYIFVRKSVDRPMCRLKSLLVCPAWQYANDCQWHFNSTRCCFKFTAFTHWFGKLYPYHLGNTKSMGMLIDKAFWICHENSILLLRILRIVWCRGCFNDLPKKNCLIFWPLGWYTLLWEIPWTKKASIVDYCGFCVSREVAITTEKRKRSD